MTTKQGFLGAAASAFVLALLVNACTTNPRVTDTSGRKVSLDTPHIVEHHLSHGKIVIYANTPDDINRLIRELQQLGVTDRQILSPEAWSGSSCKMIQNGTCQAQPPCPAGTNCKLAGLQPETRQVVPTQWRNIAVPFKWCQCLP